MDPVAKAYGDAALWQSGAQAAVAAAADMLAERRPFADVLALLSAARRDIAERQNTPGWQDFGRKRVAWDADLLITQAPFGPLYIESYLSQYGPDDVRLYQLDKTPMGERYLAAAEQGRALLDAPGRLDGVDFAPLTVPGYLAATNQTPTLRGYDLSGYRCLGRIDGRTVELTGAVFLAADALAAMRFGAFQPVIGLWLHTAPEHIDEILAHVSDLHGEVADGSLTALARAAWWLGHAMPVVRGSAAIGHWYVAAALARHGRDFGAPAEALDLAAFRLSEAEYAAGFQGLFQAD